MAARLKNGWTIFAIFLIAVNAKPVWAWSGKVTHVTDGDTLWVRPAAGGPALKIRIDGIDAPEICQAGGLVARAALAGRVAGRTVTLETRRQDDYGRSVASLALKREDMAAWMVGRGQAWSYHYGRDGGQYLGLQKQAQAARRGLFADPAALKPRIFRKRNGPCPA